MKHVYSKLAIALFSFAALSSYAQADNHQSVTVRVKLLIVQRMAENQYKLSRVKKVLL